MPNTATTLNYFTATLSLVDLRAGQRVRLVYRHGPGDGDMIGVEGRIIRILRIGGAVQEIILEDDLVIKSGAVICVL